MDGDDLLRRSWPRGVQRLIDDARFDVEQLLARGLMDRVVDLSRRTGVDFDPTYFPMYFTGAFEAPLVLVHLNPKLSDRLTGPRFRDFSSYLDRHRRFGYHNWERDPSYRSAFDHKQVRFLRPFGVIDFVPGTDAC